MLSHLQIRHFAVVESLALDIERGMTVLTGETGAGKSILIGAISLALGDRAESQSVRQGHDKAEITLVFDIKQANHVHHWLVSHELDAEHECILRRVIHRDGRSRAFINGNPVPVQRLKELGHQLIDIHGQHAHHALLDPNTHLDLFDEYAHCLDLKQQLKKEYKSLQTLEKELQQLQQQTQERQLRLDYLEYQLNELEKVAPREGEWQSLCQEQKQLASQEKWLNKSQQLHTLLTEHETSLCDQLQAVMKQLIPITSYHGHLENALELLTQAEIYLNEAGDHLDKAQASANHDPEQLHHLEQRLSELHELARKHRIEPDALPAHIETLSLEKAQLQQSENNCNELEQKITQHRNAYQHIASLLSAQRQSQLDSFNKIITSHMRTLGITGGTFQATLVPNEEHTYNSYGNEGIVFNVNTNPGLPARQLHKIASGGELSRISLAIEVANRQHHLKTVLVFDEVDVGIGGGIADRVGQYLHQLSENAQILCITHLAQVASHADHHCKIVKTIQHDQTTTSIYPLAHQDKIDELARMMGGLDVTAKTRESAQELLKSSQKLGDVKESAIE